MRKDDTQYHKSTKTHENTKGVHNPLLCFGVFFVFLWCGGLLKQMSAVGWAIITAGIWGIAPLLEKLGLTQSHPVAGVFARSLGVLVGVIIFGAWWSPWKAVANLSLRTLMLLAGGGFLASFVGQLAFYRALKAGHLSQVVPVAGAYPLVAALLGWWLLREPLNPLRVVGTILIVVGVVLSR